MKKTYLFHDYETYGLNTRKTRVSQFAAIRTDEDFNIIPDEEYDLLSIPPIDFIPSIGACLVTGITPQSIIRDGKENFNDYQLFSKISDIFNFPGTCSLGYNSLQFDDEITRNGFFRNLLPIYNREFKSECSRFDIIDVLREFAFLFPEDIKIPKDENNIPIFKLDQVAPLNDFKEDSYHNAFTDVKATIFLAKLMKEKRPEFWNFRINTYKKADVMRYMDKNISEPFIYTHSTNGGVTNFVEPILIVMNSYPENNNYIGIKLSNFNSINDILNIPLTEIKKVLFMKNEELLKKGIKRLPFVKITANKIPIITSFNDEILHDKLHEIKNEEIERSIKFIQNNISTFKDYAKQAFKNEEFVNHNKNHELMIYGDGFYSKPDESKISIFRQDMLNKNFSKYITENIFSSQKLNELARKVIFRNFNEDIISDPILSPYYLSFLKRSYNLIKNGFDHSYNYSEEEINDDNFNNNDKMIEHTISDLRDILPKLTEEYKEDKDKSSIINDFKSSLNLLISEYKEKNNIMSNKVEAEKKEKNKTFKP